MMCYIHSMFPTEMFSDWNHMSISDNLNLNGEQG
jgi:hypothetical protein